MNVRLRYDMNFAAGVFYNGELRMNNYTLRLSMTTNSHDANNHNTAFSRIKYFIYEEIDSTIFINSENTSQCQLYATAGLKITTMPGEPVDQLIGIMLFHKLNAIVENRMVVEETELASILGDSMYYLHSGNETTSIENEPDWWYSADIIHCDYNILNAENIVSIPQTSAWRELEMTWPDTEDNSESTNTIVFADFKKE